MAYMNARKARIESALSSSFPAEEGGLLFDAMRHAVLSGGKRIRPLLVLGACEAVCSDESSEQMALVIGCAAELIHSLSLILDDLPMFDNDVLRRGVPSCHARFGEPVAILAACSLFARAFQLLTDPAHPMDPERAHRVISILSNCLIPLASGQLEDKLAETRTTANDTLDLIHYQKTASLIRACLILGGIAGRASDEALAALAIYGESVGMAFQIVDDVLNETGDARELGKPSGSDAKRRKATFAKVYGVSTASDKADAYVATALRALDASFGPSADPLRWIAKYVLIRRA